MTLRERDISEVVAKELDTKKMSPETALQIIQMVARLEGVTLDKKSQLGAATIGSAVTIYDAAFDRYDIRTAKKHAIEIQNLIDGEDSGELTVDTRVQKAIAMAHENLNPAALDALKKLTIAQTDSLEQRDASTSRSKIEDITKRKGANSVLLFALEASPDLSEARRRCYEELGFLVQLLDDFQDETTDVRDGIHTLVNTLDRPESIVLIKNQYKKVREVFSGEYEEYQLIELFGYIDKLMAKAGILG